MDDERLPFANRGKRKRSEATTEQAIFAATEELLTTRALSELTVEDILQSAGVSRTTFYRNFRSKFRVVSALLEAVQLELVQTMQPWFKGGTEPVGALHLAVMAVAGRWQRHRPILRAGAENWFSEPEVGRPWVAMMDRFVDDIAEHIDAERAAGRAPAGVASRDVARTLVWSSERMLYLAGFGMCGDAMELAVVEPLVAMWVGMIYRSDGPPR